MSHVQTQNVADQPHCDLLAKAGWKWPTHSIYWLNDFKQWVMSCRHHYHHLFKKSPERWLPAPSIGELRRELTKVDLRNYWYKVIRREDDYTEADFFQRTLRMEMDYSDWLYKVTSSANALAEVWLWAQKEKS